MITEDPIAQVREPRLVEQTMGQYCSSSVYQYTDICHSGTAETVLTFPAYLQNAARTFKAKGASVIISSQTPHNPYEGGRFQYSASRFVDLAKTRQLQAEPELFMLIMEEQLPNFSKAEALQQSTRISRAIILILPRQVPKLWLMLSFVDCFVAIAL